MVRELGLHLKMKEDEVEGLSEHLGEGIMRNGVFRGRSIELQDKGSGSQPETKEVCPKEG